MFIKKTLHIRHGLFGPAAHHNPMAVVQMAFDIGDEIGQPAGEVFDVLRV